MNQTVRPERLIKTRFRVMTPQADRGAVESEVMWPRVPGYGVLTAAVEPILNGNLEHVTVLADYDGGTNYVRLDMFVHETGVVDGLPRNEAATTIYRRNWLLQHPGTDPESMPFIAGVAILFDRRVW